MLISSAEGYGFFYDVTARSDGYLVQVRDRETGATIEEEERLFRHAPAAFAYADYAAALDLAAAQHLMASEDDEREATLLACESRFSALSSAYADEGVSHAYLAAWSELPQARQRAAYH